MKTRKLLVSSVIMILTCCLLFAGATFAWFSDSVTSGNNIITAGNLDVGLSYSKDGKTWSEVKEDTQLFDGETLWEPGHVEVVILEVSNLGSLSMKYSLALDFVEEASVNVLGESFKLSDYLLVGSKVTDDLDTAVVENRNDALALATDTDYNKDGFNAVIKETLGAGESDYIQLAIAMPTTVGNEANHARGEAAPSIVFSINLYATQLNHENDSFGADYDKDAVVYTVADANKMLKEGKDTTLVNCYEPSAVLEVPADYKGTLTLFNVKVASINGASNVVVLGDVVIKATEEGMSAITGKAINISGTGNLTAVGAGTAGFGIGGLDTESINIEGIAIDYVAGGHAYGVGSDTKYYKDAPEGGAAIGSGLNGSTISLNDVTIVKAIGGSKAAAIGARYHVGVNVNINNSTVLYAEGGVSAAAIGGSRVSNGALENGTTINIVNSEITAQGGAYGAGIGSGYDTHCQAVQPLCTINIADSKIDAQGGKYGAGIGTGFHTAALAGEITNSEINAAAGEAFYKDSYTMAMGVGFGIVDPAREGQQVDSKISYNGTVISLSDAPYGAKVSNNEMLDEAIKAGKDTIILAEGTYVIPVSAQGKILRFIGSGENTVIATLSSGSYEGCNYNLLGSTVVFENITINTDNQTYTGYASANVTFKNCTINGSMTLYGESLFENTTLNVEGDQYNIWTWGSPKATFNNCTFNSDGKAILVYGGGNTELRLNGCTFNDSGVLPDLKAAIEVGSGYGSKFNIYVNNTVVNGYEITNKGINTGTTLWGNKNSMTHDELNVVVDGVDVY